MAVSNARLAEPLEPISLETTTAALVIGGGIAGMVSALNLAEQGFEVHLVEKAMKNSAYACLYKPIDMEKLLGLVSDIRERKQKAGELGT